MGSMINNLWGRREGDHIVALDLADGSKAWSYRTAGEDMPSPAIVGNLAIFANGDDHAYALNVTTGEAVWRVKTGGVSTMASATTDGQDVFLSACDFENRIVRTTSISVAGRIRWTAPYGNCDSSPTLAAGRLFLSGFESDQRMRDKAGRNTVTALAANTGKVLWSFRSRRIGLLSSVGSSERAIAGTYWGGLYFQAIPTTDEFVALDASNGSIRWSFRSTGPIKMSCVIRNGRLYVGDTAGLLYVLSAKDGSLISARIFEQPFSTSPPVIIGSTLLIAGATTLFTMHI
jgi:outer membrane protein assembly factor BamB